MIVLALGLAIARVPFGFLKHMRLSHWLAMGRVVFIMYQYHYIIVLDVDVLDSFDS